MRTAVFPASRLYYHDVIPSVKAILLNSSVEEVILTIEDDVFPEHLPSCVRTVNVRGQQYFRPDSINAKRNPYVYLCLLRVVYAEMFPNLDRVVSLDADAFVDRWIGSELWDMDMTGKYMAGVPETRISAERGYPYFNAGMLVLNLEEIRRDRLHEQMLSEMNRNWHQWVEQDVLNEYCKGRTIPLGSEWNAAFCTAPVGDAKIIHYAANRGWTRSDSYLKYSAMDWSRE